MDIEQFNDNKEAFLKNKIYKECPDELKKIFLTLFGALEKEYIKFTIKIRKDNSIVLSPMENINKNIITMWIYKKHLRISIYNKVNLNAYSKEDINESLINNIKKRYYELNKEKKQISIYLDEAILNKVQEKAKKSNKKLNEFITETIEDKVNDIFINKNHKREFSALLKDSGIYSEEDKYKDGIPKNIIKKVVFFYLVSAYQNDYLELYESKFQCNKKTGEVTGPSYLDEYWEDDIYNICAAAYGIAKVLFGESSLEILMEILKLNNSAINKLLSTAVQLMNGTLYTIYKDEIVIKKVDFTFDLESLLK